MLEVYANIAIWWILSKMATLLFHYSVLVFESVGIVLLLMMWYLAESIYPFPNFSRWRLWKDKWFHNTFYGGYDYLPMLGLRLIHITEGALGSINVVSADNLAVAEVAFPTYTMLKVIWEQYLCGMVSSANFLIDWLLFQSISMVLCGR